VNHVRRLVPLEQVAHGGRVGQVTHHQRHGIGSLGIVEHGAQAVPILLRVEHHHAVTPLDQPAHDPRADAAQGSSHDVGHNPAIVYQRPSARPRVGLVLASFRLVPPSPPQVV
jgi:hypothetical protein